jgi:hypothetical protein
MKLSYSAISRWHIGTGGKFIYIPSSSGVFTLDEIIGHFGDALTLVQKNKIMWPLRHYWKSKAEVL